ncbi:MULTISPECIES: hypothetical protein [unclassified Clostridium]|uniref:hypothetical protein n=1 Tax=unclassified Clostridium TaxID=2614128 RepID=UPI000EC28A07|nr:MULTISPECIES: hypothetical protein [unclassified Clostridium]HCQ91332.1 hypothetical protein [Clostridium sp.]
MKNNSTIKRFIAFFIFLFITMAISPKIAALLLTIVPLAYLIFLFKKSNKFKSRNIIIKGIISTFLLCTVLTGIGGIATEFETSNEPTKKIQQITSNKNSILTDEKSLEENSKDGKEEAKRIAEEKAKREEQQKKESELKAQKTKEEQARKEVEEKARRDAEEKKQLEESIANNNVSENSNVIESEVELESEIVNDDISTVVYITKTGEKYHSDGCGYLSRSKIEITLENAMNRGYTPCSRCGPPQ